MDILEQALIDLQKQIQKIRILAHGFSRNNTSSNNADKVKKDKKAEVGQVKSVLSLSSDALSHSVKGAFGKKITTTLDKQKQLLDNL